jgi:hypothetical protein
MKKLSRDDRSRYDNQGYLAPIRVMSERDGPYDKTIQTLIDAFPENRDYSSVLNKVVVINRLLEVQTV